MTSDGVKAYAWDAENRLIKITYPGSGNYSQILYDASGIKGQITETVVSTVTSTKQFVNSGSQICDERDASSAVVKKFVGGGQTINGSNYFYFFDHLGSVHDMTDSLGAVQASYEYERFGQSIERIANQTADFQFAGYYAHSRSGLNSTKYRHLSTILGRWLSRDPLGENGGFNLYAYCGNESVNCFDPLGLMASRGGSGNGGRGRRPPCFSPCDSGDLECCESRRNDCQSRCRQRYRDRPGPGNDFLSQCLRCCWQTYNDCMRHNAPDDPFSGTNWEYCFKNPSNKQSPGKPKSDAGKGTAGGGWPSGPSSPQKKDSEVQSRQAD